MISDYFKDIYEHFIEHYKNVHVNPWHNISEDAFCDLVDKLITSMNINDEYSFNYFIKYLVKRLNGKEDAHTKYSRMDTLPMNFRIFDGEVLVNYPESLKGYQVCFINDIYINKIIDELDDITSYGTEGKRKYELEKSFMNRVNLFSLPSLHDDNSIVFTLKGKNGEIIKREFIKEHPYLEEMFDYHKYFYGDHVKYEFKGDTLIYTHRSIQNSFRDEILDNVARLEKEDMSKIKKIIVDIRGNTGGNSELNVPLMNFLKKHLDKTLICLTDYRVYSGGRYALIDLINLGTITIGEEIATPINCYGESNYINYKEHPFSSSSRYFDPSRNIGIASKIEYDEIMNEELLKPYIFKPDILVNEKKSDYLNGIDTILEYAINYPNLEFRPLKDGDDEFVYKLKELGMKWYIEKIYSWDDKIQREYTRNELLLHRDDTKIITINDEDVGVTTFYKEDDTYVVGLLIIHPDYQNKGIATGIIRKYIHIARENGKRITIKTYKENPARKLYERLGFKVYNEDKTHSYLEINWD